MFLIQKTNSPDLSELIATPVSSHADDDVDLLSSSTVSALRSIDSSDVQMVDVEPFLFVTSWIGLVCVDVDVVLHPVIEMPSRSSSIFNTGKFSSVFIAAAVAFACNGGFAYFLRRTSAVAFLLPPIAVSGFSRLNDCNGMYVCV